MTSGCGNCAAIIWNMVLNSLNSSLGKLTLAKIKLLAKL